MKLPLLLGCSAQTGLRAISGIDITVSFLLLFIYGFAASNLASSASIVKFMTSDPKQQTEGEKRCIKILVELKSETLTDTYNAAIAAAFIPHVISILCGVAIIVLSYKIRTFLCILIAIGEISGVCVKIVGFILLMSPALCPLDYYHDENPDDPEGQSTRYKLRLPKIILDGCLLLPYKLYESYVVFACWKRYHDKQQHYKSLSHKAIHHFEDLTPEEIKLLRSKFDMNEIGEVNPELARNLASSATLRKADHHHSHSHKPVANISSNRRKTEVLAERRTTFVTPEYKVEPTLPSEEPESDTSKIQSRRNSDEDDVDSQAQLELRARSKSLHYVDATEDSVDASYTTNEDKKRAKKKNKDMRKKKSHYQVDTESNIDSQPIDPTLDYFQKKNGSYSSHKSKKAKKSGKKRRK